MDTMTRPFPDFELPPAIRPETPDPDRGPGAAPPAVSPPRTRRVAGLVALALVAGAAGGVAGRALDSAGPAGPAAAAVSRASSRLAGAPLDVAGIIAAVEPATVAIEVTYGAGPFTRGTGAGTGVVLTAGGDVLTNAHVVDGASAIRVVLAGEAQSRAAQLVGADRAADLALLRIPGASGLPTADLGRSADVQVGDDVVAIGNALALRGGPSVTRGIVSALDRSIDTDTGAITGLIQTDASISSGNSGGPLVNAAGEVVGINTAVATAGGAGAAENIGFAIAIDRALPVVERLRGGDEAPAAAWLGVRAADPPDGSRGASVVAVEAGSPAAAAGLRAGDLVTAVGGEAVAGADQLGGAVRRHAPGERVDVDVVRDGEAGTVPVELGTRP